MKYAIVESGGKQYRAVEGGMLEVDRLPVEPGAQVKLEQVLLLAEEGIITVGAPVIKDTPIWTKVIDHFKGKKVTIFNYSPKKRIRVKTGHRQNYTRLLVEQIGGKELVKKEPAPKVVEVETTAEAVTKIKAAPVKGAATAAKKTATKPAAKTAESKAKTTAKTTTKKPAAKPAAGKTEKAAKGAEKPAKSGSKKPAVSGKKPAAK